MMKKIISLTAAIFTAAALSPAAGADGAFKDMDGHWAEENVNTLFESGIVSGMPDGLFHPDDNVTTEQFIAMALRAKKGEIAPVNGDWASGYTDYARKNGIAEDYDAETAKTDIDRRGAARIAHEILLREYGERDESDWSAAENLKDLYSCHTCVMHIAQMYVKGIMTGRADDLFDVYGTLTRAEAAAIISRMSDRNMRILPEKNASSTARSISEDELEKMSGAVIIDVREAAEYETGHIPGSINIPLADMYSPEAGTLPEDKNTAIVLYCASGSRSAMAAEILSGMGYCNLYNFGGIGNWTGKTE